MNSHTLRGIVNVWLLQECTYDERMHIVRMHIILNDEREVTTRMHIYMSAHTTLIHIIIKYLNAHTLYECTCTGMNIILSMDQ